VANGALMLELYTHTPTVRERLFRLVAFLACIAVVGYIAANLYKLFRWGETKMREKGQSFAETAVLTLLVGIVIIGTVRLVGNSSANTFSTVATAVSGDSGDGSDPPPAPLLFPTPLTDGDAEITLSLPGLGPAILQLAGNGDGGYTGVCAETSAGSGGCGSNGGPDGDGYDPAMGQYIHGASVQTQPNGNVSFTLQVSSTLTGPVTTITGSGTVNAGITSMSGTASTSNGTFSATIDQ
jgi:Flp pilus assembly pilin Flp